MHRVIIAEKPDVARRIARAIFGGGFKEEKYRRVPIYVSGSTYIVPASGHLYDLDFIADFNRGWTYPVLPRIDEYRYVPIKGKTHFIEAIKRVYRRLGNDYLVIVATDLDRRGSYIAMQILEMVFGVDPKSPKVRRMVFNALTPEELRGAYAKLSPMDVSRAYSGWCQDRLDLLWGANLTRALTWAYRRGGGRDRRVLSAGRVQTPALRLVYERCREIEEFKPKTFYTVKARFRTEGGEEFEAVYGDGKRFDSFAEAQGVAQKLMELSWGRAEAKRYVETVNPPTPFSISDLQKEASALFGFKPTVTKSLAQKLYEKGLISYPRSGSTKFDVSRGKHDQQYFRRLLGKLRPYRANDVDYVAKVTDFRPRQGRTFDGAHPPIHAVAAPTKPLPRSEARLYDLVFSRTLAILSPPAKVERVRLDISMDGHKLSAAGSRVVYGGWMGVYRYHRFKEASLPRVEDGERVKVVNVGVVKGETRPPPYYTRAALIKTMEKLGLGTPATRDAEVEILVKRGYVEGKRGLRITPLGRAVIETLIAEVPVITTPELTAKMEEMLRMVEFGRMSPEEFYEKTLREVGTVIREFKKKELEIGLRLVRAVGAGSRSAKRGSERRRRRGEDGSPYKQDGFSRYLSEFR